MSESPAQVMFHRVQFNIYIMLYRKQTPTWPVTSANDTLFSQWLRSAPFTCSTLSRGQGSILAILNLPPRLEDKRHQSAVQTRPVPAASTYCRSSYCKSFYCLFCSHVPLQCRQKAKQNKKNNASCPGQPWEGKRREWRVSSKAHVCFQGSLIVSYLSPVNYNVTNLWSSQTQQEPIASE